MTRQMVVEGRFDQLSGLVRQALLPRSSYSMPRYLDISELHALVRIAFYGGETKLLDELVKIMFEEHGGALREHPVTSILNNPFDAAWTATLDDKSLGYWMTWVLMDSVGAGTDARAQITFSASRWDRWTREHRITAILHANEFHFYQGHLEVETALPAELEVSRGLFRARALLAQGRAGEAATEYHATYEAFKRVTGKRKPVFPSINWIYYIIALIGEGEQSWSLALELAERGARTRDFDYADLSELAKRILRVQMGLAAQPDPYESWQRQVWTEHRTVYEKVTALLLDVWLGRAPLKHSGGEAVKLYEHLEANGYRWLAHELAAILDREKVKGEDFGKRLMALGKEIGCTPLLALLKEREEWERSLNALLELTRPEALSGAPEKASRLVWVVSDTEVGIYLEAKEQKRQANGKWTRGRVVPLRRLREEGRSLGFLTEQDLAACEHISVESDPYGWGRHSMDYTISIKALAALAGHPLVFREDGYGPIEVVAKAPELRVAATDDAYNLEMIPGAPQVGDVLVIREGDTRLVVYEYTAALRRVAQTLGKGLRVPARAKDQVLQAVRNVSSVVTVHSDIGVGDESIPRVAADPVPVAQLLPAGAGLLVHLRVRPLSAGGPVFPPGAGGEVVIAELDGRHVQAARDFAAERAGAEAFLAACPSLVEPCGEGEWRLETPEEALEFLEEAQACGEIVRLEWPKGQTLNIQGSAGAGQFRAKITGGHNWFEVSGEVRVNEELVIDMQRLLDLTAGSRSRFVQIADGQFLALTQAFRRKLDELRGIGEERDGALRLHALAAPLMEDLVAEAGAVRGNKQWKAQLARLQDARDLKPEIPSTLRATLRDYQVDGYVWLARLAEWGVGACLADDMGLGKTVQALALMLRRAPGGPQLVIAPTSVCANWEEEAIRFAPSLRVHRIGQFNRAEVLDNLGPFDLLITSYGILQSEIALFREREWETIVLDEAQAIKNLATKRSRAAMDLNGKFKIAATGTPIENHLGELWNLFRFINPGFLGSLERFNARYAIPIEKNEDRERSRSLKQLIQPFMLRRRKEDVLDELPARTDIVLHVELGDKERAFYEALRQRALKQLADVEAAPGKHHVRILAEIMRLRRACCNSKLVDESAGLPSAKLEVFEAVLDELMENRHKALVFSQFVDHLSILRALLDKKGVSYQYLDGSTPTPARKKAVDAFQGGEGDVFLISLKAGGLGLNLTAADYVIHMDPWWNPAVEDQASDRAHRIGQQRPVTVYRLVARDTIEDQITALHHRKRDLANSLLEGADMAGKVSAEELLALLRNG